MSTELAPVPGARLVSLIARLVPPRRREEWLAEWRTELSYAWDQSRAVGSSVWRARLALRLRAAGSVTDAVFLRRKHGGSGRWGWHLREALRALRRRPGFAGSVILTLALGMGSATAIFSALDGLMLRPIPFRDVHELVGVLLGGAQSVDLEAIRELKQQDGVIAEARAYAPRSVVLTGAGEPRGLLSFMVEPGFLTMLGIQPQLGRGFTADEAVPGRDRVVILGHDLWRTTFGEDAGVLGRTVELSGERYTVIGVLPPTLRRMPNGIVSMLLPLTDPPPYDRLNVMARLRPGLSVAAASARLADRSAVLERERPRPAGWALSLRTVERRLNPATKNALYSLAAAVGFLLLIACTNAAGLLFVRGVSKVPELGLRVALGGSRRTLFAHVFAESLVLAVLAGLAGTLLAWWGVRVLVALAPSNLIDFSYTTVGIDLRVLLFALVLTFLTAVLFGVAPALRASRVSAARAGRASTATRGQVRGRSIVQVAQLALAAMLLTGAGLTGRSFLRLTGVDPGFDADNLLIAHFTSGSEGREALNRTLDERLRALPGVRGVAWNIGTTFHFGFHLEPEGEAPRPSENSLLVSTSVDSGFFRTMGIPILEGRGFRAEDTYEGANTVVIDSDFAGTLWPGERAVGRRFRLRQDDSWLTVVGVSGDVKLEGPDDPVGPDLVFHPIAIERIGYTNLFIRTAGDPAALAPTVRQVIRELAPDRPIGSIKTGEQMLAEQVAEPRFVLTLMTVFAAIALVLAAVGVYSLVAFTVAQRTREIGVRMALGAHERDILFGVLRSGLLLAGAGIAIGLCGAAALSRFIRSLLFGISPFDVVAFAFVAAMLVLACLLALAGPARRAAGVQPATALRAE